MEFPQKFSWQLFSRSARLHKSADFWLKISIKWHEFLISCKAGSVSHLIELIDSNCWQNKHERDFVLQVRCRDLNNSCDKISTLRGMKAVTNISWDKIATKKIWQSLCNLQDLVYFETSDWYKLTTFTITSFLWTLDCKFKLVYNFIICST